MAKRKMERKAYLVLYACSLTRAVHMELLKSLEVAEFVPSLKRLIARRGRPEIIYSDNATTFKAAEKWLRLAQKDEKLNLFLTKRKIEWRFNLSRAPWWLGAFERLIGLFKRSFYKSVGNGRLTWEELSEVILDVEVALNNRPLSYVEDEIEQPVLTPNKLLHINPNDLPEVKPHHQESTDLRKRAKQLKKYKDQMWRRWTQEYIRGLREHHKQRNGGKQSDYPNHGDVVTIEGEERNRNMWKIGILEDLIRGRDGVVRGVRLRTAKGRLERAVQQLYPLELSCDLDPKGELNPAAPESQPKPRRDAAVAAEVTMQQHVETEEW
ncbi:uncharacterized protein LOC124438683 [Xenia sp. Carnegie-2017]|uniref:uncharacterized protein LOC124438683 n=1 Tax=Xenia sp. Carnegie-2017 TaxID=2897299 RepID=UPI001F04A6FD|nr:uncharacterized protein LOC124438683 [Xenia sp. Carnegie-2017]